MSRLLPTFVLGLTVLAVSACGSSSPTPAATVNGHDISMSTYQTQFRYDRTNAVAQAGFDVCADKTTNYMCNNIKQSSLNIVIARELVREYAAKHRIAVTNDAFNRHWAVIYKTKFGSQKILKAFVGRYHMSVADLKSRVRDDMLRERVAARVTQNAPATAPAIRLGRLEAPNKLVLADVQKRLKAGQSFATIGAVLNTEADAACNKQCGDLGWIPVAFLPPQQRSLGQAPAGKIIGPLNLQKGGYEYYQVEARDEHYHLTPQQQLTMKNQVIFPQWLTSQIHKASVQKHVAT